MIQNMHTSWYQKLWYCTAAKGKGKPTSTLSFIIQETRFSCNIIMEIFNYYNYTTEFVTVHYFSYLKGGNGHQMKSPATIACNLIIFSYVQISSGSTAKTFRDAKYLCTKRRDLCFPGSGIIIIFLIIIFALIIFVQKGQTHTRLFHQDFLLCFYTVHKPSRALLNAFYHSIVCKLLRETRYYYFISRVLNYSQLHFVRWHLFIWVTVTSAVSRIFLPFFLSYTTVLFCCFYICCFFSSSLWAIIMSQRFFNTG